MTLKKAFFESSFSSGAHQLVRANTVIDEDPSLFTCWHFGLTTTRTAPYEFALTRMDKPRQCLGETGSESMWLNPYPCPLPETLQDIPSFCASVHRTLSCNC